MIRDPSDGTIKEISPEANEINAVAPKTAHEGIILDTGLRQPTRTDAQERLEKSRQWLKDYQSKQEQQNARGNDDTEHSTDGRAVNDQGEAESAVRGGDGANPGAHRQG